jgi:hypothetical protein
MQDRVAKDTGKSRHGSRQPKEVKPIRNPSQPYWSPEALWKRYHHLDSAKQDPCPSEHEGVPGGPDFSAAFSQGPCTLGSSYSSTMWPPSSAGAHSLHLPPTSLAWLPLLQLSAGPLTARARGNQDREPPRWGHSSDLPPSTTSQIGGGHLIHLSQVPLGILHSPAQRTKVNRFLHWFLKPFLNMVGLRSKSKNRKTCWRLLIKTRIPWLPPGHVHPKHDLSIRYQESKTEVKEFVGHFTPPSTLHCHCLTA